MIMQQEEGRLRDQFLINLRRFSTGNISVRSAAEADDLDARLNTVYDRIQQLPESRWQYETVRPEGIRDVEDVWIKLRDARVQLSAIVFPNLTAAAVRAQITRLRLHQLESLPPRK
ncbi:MAG: DUF1311 domain-containing protein [Acidobacteriota bacterium]|nr:DUF1311 domain-containing protein [Acidobacteriota bacterium]